MIEYTSKRYIDGKVRQIIVDENGNIINRTPSKDELKGLDKHLEERQRIRGYYNDTNTCDECKIEKLIPGETYRECDNKGNWTGRWICKKCYMIYDYHKRPDTNHNIIKSLAKCRTGNLDPNCSSAKGYNFEKLTSIWKGVKILSNENDNYNGPLDHSADSEGKIPQTKGKFYDSYNQYWSQSLTTEHNAIANGFEFDYLIFYCASKDGKIIERIYEFPIEELLKRTGIKIIKNPDISRGTWTEKYRIKDEETIKKVNDIWKEIIQ